jgi:transcriptional regulator with XRE-family HTH domain
METESKETLNRLKKYFEKEGLTQKTFAEKYGIKPSYVSAIFVGRRAISAGLMKSMMQAGEGPALTWILTGNTDETKNLKSELRDCRTLISSLERVISNSMKG